MCSGIIDYKSVSQYNEATKRNRTCRGCAAKFRAEKRRYKGSLIKICKNCGKEHVFSSYQKFNCAKPDESYWCKHCATILSRKTFRHTPESKEKLKVSHLGKKASMETKKKLSELRRGEKNPCYGRHGSLNPMYGKSGKLSPTFGIDAWNKGLTCCFNSDTIKKMKRAKKSIGKWKGETNPNYGNHAPLSMERRRKIRLAHIHRIERLKLNGCSLKPNFNITACRVIEDYGKAHGYKFQTAMNGGEYYIPELGYWVDGFDKEKNVVIDYYEDNHHHYTKDGKMKEKDIQRIDEITQHLNCKFIILEENKL